ncbi:helix-turn-helix domain-containing protein [Altererythrobacter lutimaris]|uniref:Helix-turn-helix transcriptional regulator n=1 Tax=Altererythrobacter lutimaris TaxID=2743979 RepID=A0A850H8K7_9SPHN|nr:AraC family transcriptional regulator [Altererythrobacter lutimaris]NVE93860.1 helix-turn-helix transcriptional regulator [Altererythrobacter lutimaris]
MLPLIPTLAALATFLAVLMGAFLMLVPSRMRLANIALALFLLATAVDISGWFMGDWWAANPSIDQFRVAIAFAQMPLFTGYIWLNCFHREAIHPRDALHFLPAVATLAAVAADVSLPYLRALFELQYAAYMALAIYALWRVRSAMTEHYTGSSANWNWLAVIVACSLVAHTLFVVRTVFAAGLHAELLQPLQTTATCLVLAITVLFALQAMLNPGLFRTQDRLLASVSNPADNHSQGEQDQRLLAFMEEHRPYLDPDLSLDRLARRSGVTAKEISVLINQRHGVHFFDFINRYRIEHAKRLLVETDQTVTEILFASGFNAKSSFNSAFRKHASTTPSMFRKENGTK